MSRPSGVGMGRKGIPRSLSHRRAMAVSKVGSKNHQWAGDKVSYKTLHQWVRRNSIVPSNCQSCNKLSKLDAANISGNYLRDLSDWKFLCRKCHMGEDGRLEKWQDRNYNGRIRNEEGRIVG